MRRRTLRILAIILLLGSPTRAAAEESLADLVRALGVSPHASRIRARDALVARQDPNVVAPIIDALPGLDLTGRSLAQNVLEALPVARTTGPLRALLRSRDPELRALGAASLHRKGDPSGIPVGVEVLRRETLSEDVQWAIVVRLYSVRHTDVSAAFRDRLPGLTGNPLRYAFIHVMLVEDRLAIPAVAALAKTDDLSVRTPVRALLYLLGETAVVDALAADLADPKGDVRTLQDAFRFLAPVPSPDAKILEGLCDRIDGDSRPTIRMCILDQMATWRSYSVLDRLEPLIDDPDAGVARAAIGVMVSLGGRGRAATLMRALRDTDGTKRVLAAEGLYRLDDASGLPVVIEALGSKKVADRREAARVMGVYTLRRAVPQLLDALEDPDLTVRRNALEGLSRVLTALFPYHRFDWSRVGDVVGGTPQTRAESVAVLRTWWEARPR